VTGITVLDPADLYHVGLIVPDLDAAATRFTAITGYRWTKPVEYTLAVTTPAGEQDVPFKFVYSVQAPHLELIAEAPGTIWTAKPDAATHHLGYWVDDLPTAAAGLEAAGYRQEARPSGDTLSMFAYYIDAAGSRIELVDRALFADWPAFLTTMSA
jgi:catechol 2,3-dioxygenase-like lactoylglutathione lyase family enzyme